VSTAGENARTGFYTPAPTPVHWIVRHSSPRFAIERRGCGTVPSGRRFVKSPANLPGRLILPLLPFRGPFPDIPDIVLTAGITAGPVPGQVQPLGGGWPGPSSAVLPQLERHRPVLQQYLHVLEQHPPVLPHPSAVAEVLQKSAEVAEGLLSSPSSVPGSSIQQTPSWHHCRKRSWSIEVSYDSR